MTEPEAETQEPAEDADSAPELEDTLEQHDPAEAVKKARADAAGYRRRLRDTETQRDTIAVERDALVSKLQTRQRSEIETIASQRLRDGTDLWTATDLPGCLGEDGEVDPAKVLAHTEALVQSKPHYSTPPPNFELGVRGESVPTEATFADVLRGGRHGS